MKTKGKVSIVMSSHNNEGCVGRMMYSLLNSTYTDLEILCFDNNSSDKTVEILKEFENEDERVKVFEKSSNLQSKLEKVTGEFVMFVNGTDELMFDGIANIMNGFNQEVDVVVSGVRYDNNKGELVFATPSKNITGKISDSEVFAELCNLNNNGKYVAYARIYRKSILEKVENISNEYELLMYSTKCMEKANKIALLNMVTYKYAPYPSKKSKLINELEYAKQTTNCFVKASEKYFSGNAELRALAGVFVLSTLFALAGSSKQELEQGLNDEMVMESVLSLSNQIADYSELKQAVIAKDTTFFEKNCFVQVESNRSILAKSIAMALSEGHSGGVAQ